MFTIGFSINIIWNKIDENTHPLKYTDLVLKYSDEYGVPETLIYAVIKVESGFEPLAQSSAGAIGLMQMMPSTFEWLSGEEHFGEYLPALSLNQPDISIRYGTYYLYYLYQKFGNWNTVLAAYNAGEGNVTKWLAVPEHSDGQGGLTYIPFDETRSYVSKVNSAIEMYQKLYYDQREGLES